MDRSVASPDFDLVREIEGLRRGHAASGGRGARTQVKHDDLRVVLMAFAAGARMAEHTADGRLTIHVVQGRVRLRVEGRVLELPAGGLLALEPGQPHDVEAVEESALLLTIVPARDDRTARL